MASKTGQEKPFWGGGGDFGWGGSGPDSKDYSSEEEVPTRARALRSQPTVPTRARALRSQPTEFDFSGDNLEEIRQKIRTEREVIKDAIAVGSKRMLTIGICSASLLDVMFDDFPTSHTPIEREKLERSYRERVEKKLGFVPNFDKVLSRLSRGLIFPHKINMKEVKIGGKEMLEASIVTKKESVPTQDWLALMRRLQPLSTKLAALEARAAELERSLPPPEPPKGGA